MPSRMELLATVAAYNDDKLLNTEECSTSTNDSTGVSPVLKHINISTCRQIQKKERISIQSTFPDNLTSPEFLRLMA